jgi:glycosyltransferase involved in cell wall biosynthesis
VFSNAIGYSVGILVGFVLNKNWSLACRAHFVPTLLRYLLVIAVAYGVNLEILIFADAELRMSPYLAQLMGVISYTLVVFVGGRYFAFREGVQAPQPVTVASSPASYRRRPAERAVDLCIVVPCYNEEGVLPETARRLSVLWNRLIGEGRISPESQVCFVDDGSRDGTWGLIESLAEEHGFIRGIKLSRNQGHQNALLAGLFDTREEVVVSIDADLQDDLGAMEEMLDRYVQGCDVVYGVRKNRASDTFFKRFTAELYYRLLRVMGIETVFNHADYRLLSRRAIEALRDFSEVNLFLRGIIPKLGFSSAIVYYDRMERFAGESKYPLKKMLALAWQGITSFSAVPLRMITVMGLLVSAASFAVTIWVLWVRLFTSEAIPGWASTALPIYFLGGVQLLSLGIIGEYVAKTYLEAKRRPRFFVERKTSCRTPAQEDR